MAEERSATEDEQQPPREEEERLLRQLERPRVYQRDPFVPFIAFQSVRVEDGNEDIAAAPPRLSERMTTRRFSLFRIHYSDLQSGSSYGRTNDFRHCGKKKNIEPIYGRRVGVLLVESGSFASGSVRRQQPMCERKKSQSVSHPAHQTHWPRAV